ncbi:hypothetical protein ACFQRB_16215 [Halobaculum litoreum]|uniref:Uncharacterized protein n=1 Tax=Halobaculum litoreum TaxID=3031998 RepID=A0ABD5XV85_9EURY
MDELPEADPPTAIYDDSDHESIRNSVSSEFPASVGDVTVMDPFSTRTRDPFTRTCVVSPASTDPRFTVSVVPSSS